MSGGLVVRPITPSRFRDVEALFGTDSIMRSGWDIWPRYAGKERAEIESRHRTKRASASSRGLDAICPRDGSRGTPCVRNVPE